MTGSLECRVPTIKTSYQSNGYAKNTQGIKYPVHESSLNYDDVMQIVLSLKTFLAGQTFEGKAPLRALKDELDSATGRIDVTKGIHQRITDPHITFEAAGHEFHLELTQVALTETYEDGSPVQRYFWKPCRVSVFEKPEKGQAIYLSYPEGTVASRETNRPRSHSITQGQIKGHVDGVNRVLQMAAEDEERKREEQKKIDAAVESKKNSALKSDGFPTLSASKVTPGKTGVPVKSAWGKQQH